MSELQQNLKCDWFAK